MIRGNLTDSETNVLNSHLDRSRVLRHKTITRVRIFSASVNCGVTSHNFKMLDRSRVLRHKTITRVRIFLGFCKLWCHLTQLQNASVGVRYNKHPIQIETDTHTHTHTHTHGE